MHDSTARPVYTPSGRFVTSELLIAAVTLGGIGLMFAAVFAWITGMDGYAVGWVWIVPAIVLVWFVRRSVAGSKCRHRGAGFGLGLVGGVVTIVGLYHID